MDSTRKHSRRTDPNQQRRRNHARRLLDTYGSSHTHASGPWWVAHERIIVDLLHDYMHQAEDVAPYNDVAPRVMAFVGQALDRFYREHGKMRLAHAMTHLYSYDPPDVDGYMAVKHHLITRVLPINIGRTATAATNLTPDEPEY